MHEHFRFSYTLIRSLLMTLDLDIQIGHFVSIVQVLDEPVAYCEESGVSLYLIPVFLSFLPSCYFLILDISGSVFIPVLDLYDIMRGCLYVILQ